MFQTLFFEVIFLLAPNNQLSLLCLQSHDLGDKQQIPSQTSVSGLAKTPRFSLFLTKLSC